MKSDLVVTPLSQCAVHPRLAKAAIWATIILLHLAFVVSDDVLRVIQMVCMLLFGVFVHALFGSFAKLGESFLGQLPDSK